MEKPLVHVFIDQENCLLSEPYVRTTLARLRADVKLHSFFGNAKAKAKNAQYFEGFDYIYPPLPCGCGKNASDFMMAIEAGRIIEMERRQDWQTRFLFYSKDRDFNTVSAHLRNSGAIAHRTAPQSERVEFLADKLSVGCGPVPPVVEDPGAVKLPPACLDKTIVRASVARLEALDIGALRYLRDDVIDIIKEKLRKIVVNFIAHPVERPKRLGALATTLRSRMMWFGREFGEGVLSAIICLGVIWMREANVVWYDGDDYPRKVLLNSLDVEMAGAEVAWRI